MASRPGLSIELNDQWKDFNKYCLAFNKNLRLASRAGLKKALQYLLGEISTRIRGGRYQRLAPMTQFLRQLEGYGSTPLLRRGGLVRSLTTDVLGDFEGAVGLLKMARGKNGKDFSNIGVLLHDGGRIKITDAMRRAFMRRLGRLADRNGTSLLKRQGSKKNILRIPARRFIEDVIKDPSVIAKVESIYAEEIKNFLKVN